LLSPGKFAWAWYVPAVAVGNVHWYEVVDSGYALVSKVEAVFVHAMVFPEGSETVQDMMPAG